MVGESPKYVDIISCTSLGLYTGYMDTAHIELREKINKCVIVVINQRLTPVAHKF